MPFARIDLAQGKPPEYRATVADVVYEGIVGVLKAPDGDRFMVIGEHAPENFVFDPHFLGIERSPDGRWVCDSRCPTISCTENR
jgi:phenylpyruvate tautomerase PptA (4-oxalocrotonate tautomerase family)